MASLAPKLKCALCSGTIDALRGDFFRASGNFLPAKDPLAPFCNVRLHWLCYGKWPERRRFARQYVQAWRDANYKNPFWWSVYQDDGVYVSVNPERPVEEASVRLCATGSDIRVPLTKWAAWLHNVGQVTPGLHAVEKEALRSILPLLLRRFPDDHALVHAINPDEKRSGAGRPRRAQQAVGR
jgi:hypothetical protein